MKHNQGFSLIEVLMASAIFALVVGLVAGLSVYFLRNSSFSLEEGQQVDQARATLTQMLREIRKIQIGADGSWPLIQTENNSFTFYADVSGDGISERVRYYLDGKNLRRGVVAPSSAPVSYPLSQEVVSIVASNVEATQSAIFSYYNGNWPADKVNNPLASSQRILNTRYVKVSLTINATTNFSAQPFELSGGVTIRNLKDNL